MNLSALYYSLLIISITTFLLALVSTSPSTTISAQEFEPTIVFVHRHGARTPQGVINQIATCQAPLCQLTKAGIAMTNSVGKYLLDNFFKPLTGVTKYDVKHVQSISTDTKRTVQSAESVLAGAFGHEIAPFVDFIPTSIDYNMSFWNSWPYYFIANARDARLAGYPSEYINQKFSQKLLDQFGDVLGAQKICSTSPVDCLILAADVLECNSSNGEPVAQILKDNEKIITDAKIVMFAKMLGYNFNDTTYTNPGSWGYDFALQMTQHLNYSRGPTNKKNGGGGGSSLSDDEWPLRIFHFSAHDWTLFPLYSAFGFWLPEFLYDTKWIPHFADTLLLQTVAPENSADNYTNPGVKAFRMYPRQVRSSPSEPVDMPSTFPVDSHEEIGLRCSDEDGNFIRFSNESKYGCSLQEVLNTIQRVRPRSELGGKCYVTKEILNNSGCLTEDAPQDESGCYKFRSVCRNMPCGSYIYDEVDPPKRCPVSGKFYKIADPARDFACTDSRPGWEIGVNSHCDDSSSGKEKEEETTMNQRFLVPNDKQTGDDDYPAGVAAPLVIVGVLVGVVIGVITVMKVYGRVADQFA